MVRQAHHERRYKSPFVLSLSKDEVRKRGTLGAKPVYAQDNIRANCIQPGAIATEMSRITWDDLDDPELIETRSKSQPSQRMGHPMDVAYAALYFASDESAFVTGATLLVDGGQSASYR